MEIPRSCKVFLLSGFDNWKYILLSLPHKSISITDSESFGRESRKDRGLSGFHFFHRFVIATFQAQQQNDDENYNSRYMNYVSLFNNYITLTFSGNDNFAALKIIRIIH